MNQPETSLPQPSEDDEISLLDLFATLLKHRRLIVSVTGLSAVAVLLYAVGSLLLPPDKSYLPNLYSPKAAMLINTPDSGGSLSSALASSGLSSLAGLAGVSAGGQSYGELSVYLSGSNTFLDAIVDKFGLIARYKIEKNVRTESRKALKDKLTAAFDEKTGVLTLSYEDIDPEFARDVVNYGVELLDGRFRTIGGNKNQLKKDQLEEKLGDVKAEMNRLEDAIQTFQQKYGVISIESLATEQIATVARVRSELMMKEMELKTYGELSRVDDPMVRRLRAERDNLAKLLDELEKGFSEYDNLLPSQKDLPKIALEFTHLKRDIMVQEAIYQLLTQQHESVKLSLSGEDPAFQVLELAEAPDQKSGPSRGMICIVAVMAAFFLSVLLAFVLEAVKNIKADAEAMAKFKEALR